MKDLQTKSLEEAITQRNMLASMLTIIDNNIKNNNKIDYEKFNETMEARKDLVNMITAANLEVDYYETLKGKIMKKLETKSLEEAIAAKKMLTHEFVCLNDIIKTCICNDPEKLDTAIEALKNLVNAISIANLEIDYYKMKNGDLQ